MSTRSRGRRSRRRCSSACSSERSVPAEGTDFLHPQTGDPAGSQKLSGRLNHLAASLFHFTQDRLDLLRWEAAQEATRTGSILVRGFCAALLAFFTLEAAATLLIAVFWDTSWRLQVIAAVLAAALA